MNSCFLTKVNLKKIKGKTLQKTKETKNLLLLENTNECMEVDRINNINLYKRKDKSII